MGGDGGTISSNRTYLRGAGKACHTADHPSNALKRAKLEEAERARLTMTTCAISGAVLDISPVHKSGGSVGGIGIVACPHGRLYKRENALEALLRRSQGAGDDDKTAPLGTYIRGMKDLYPVRFHVVPTSNGEGGYIAACPITGSEIGNGNIASYLIVRAKSKDKRKNGDTDEVDENPNVLSERAVKEMGLDGLQAEYGPFEEKDMIRLAPPRAGGVFDEIRSKWEARVEMEALAKQKKKDKKRKRSADGDNAKISSKVESPGVQMAINDRLRGKGSVPDSKRTAVDEARSTVQSAVSQSSVLSNLFGKGKKPQTEKEKAETLFTRNC